MKLIAIKSFVFLISLILSLVAVELILRVAGFYITTQREASFQAIQSSLDHHRGRDSSLIRKKDTSKYRVVAVGDSTTNGGNVLLSESFPFQLFRLQNPDDPQYQIFNYGRCEYNTAQVLSDLQKNLSYYSPHVLILLAGESDRFNPTGSSAQPYEYSNDKTPSLLYKTLRPLRIFKIARGIYLNLKYRLLKNHSLSGNFIGSDEISHYLALELLTDIEATIKKHNLLNSPQQFYKLHELMNTTHFQFNKTNNNVVNFLKNDLFLADVKNYSKYLENAKTTNIICYLYFFTFFYQQIESSLQQRQYTQLVRTLLTMIEKIPFLLDQNGDHALYHNLVWAFDFQSQYKATDILRSFKVAEEKYPNLRNQTRHQKYRELFAQEEKTLKQINANRIANLRKIVDLCLKNDIEVIIQNYPANFTAANHALKQISQEYNLPFVDNYRTFSKLKEKYPERELLEDDEHPTAFGYKIIAQNLKPTLENVIKYIDL